MNYDKKAEKLLALCEEPEDVRELIAGLLETMFNVRASMKVLMSRYEEASDNENDVPAIDVFDDMHRLKEEMDEHLHEIEVEEEDD